MFTKDSLIKTWIPTIVIMLPANLIAQHYFGLWGVALVAYGFLAFGVLMLWDSYYDLRKAGRRLAKAIQSVSPDVLDESLKNFSELYPESAESVRKEINRAMRKGPLGKQGEDGIR
jgi:hypothetical protein